MSMSMLRILHLYPPFRVHTSKYCRHDSSDRNLPARPCHPVFTAQATAVPPAGSGPKPGVFLTLLPNPPADSPRFSFELYQRSESQQLCFDLNLLCHLASVQKKLKYIRKVMTKCETWSPLTCHVAEGGLELLILLPPPWCWDCRHVTLPDSKWCWGFDTR